MGLPALLCLAATLHVPGTRVGTLHQHRVPSATFGEVRDLWVYTPPGFDPTRAYPLLVLLHGVLENADTWFAKGGASFILDELIASGQAEPLIVACPVGYGFSDGPRSGAKMLFAAPSQHRKWMEAFDQSLFRETLPYLDAHYRLRKGRENLALAGASLGGAQAVAVGLSHPDRVGWIASFSGAYMILGEADALPFKISAPPCLLWMACGEEDPLLGLQSAMAEHLGALGAFPVTGSLPGAHDHRTWREALRAFLPLLFKPAPNH